MPNEQATVEQQAQWLQEPVESELPRRPRRRLMTPIPLALMGVLLLVCGFIGGVLVEKGQNFSSSSGSGTSGFAARFASLRAAGANSSGAGAASASNGGGRAAGPFGAGGSIGAGSLGARIGQVAYVSGSTLYVTDAEGNTIKVKTSDASTVSKTVKSDVKGIHPGETVIVTGSAGAGGAVQAESIRVSEAGASGGLGTLLSGGLRGGARSLQSGGAGASGGASSGEPALFGK